VATVARHVDAPPRFDGGSSTDQQALLAVHHAWCAALDTLDNAALREGWSTDVGDWFFNANGLTYFGADDWGVHAWDFYRPMFQLEAPYTPGDVTVVIRDDMGLVAADWVGRNKSFRGQPAGAAYNVAYYRISQVCSRGDDGRWTVVHAHLSTQDTGPRPSPDSLSPALGLRPHSHRVDAARVSDAPMFDGGSAADQQALYEIHHRWCSANDWLDDDALRRIWTPAPDALLFNTNGHTYRGVEDWLASAWAYYRTRMQFARPYTPGNVKAVVCGGMGYVIADWVGRNKTWLGPENEPSANAPFYRTTQVCTNDDGTWRVMHVHFSLQSTDPRPDDSAPPRG